MHPIEMHDFPKEFAMCWHAAGRHLNDQVDGGIKGWLKAKLAPPFLEHLSFRLGNQLFFIRLIDVDGKFDGPGSLSGLRHIAAECSGHACLMPMRRQSDGRWVADRDGWGLVDARTNRRVDPPALVTADKIEMTAWELQDFAVQIVREQLQRDGYTLMSWQANPEVNPSIWFVGDSKGPEWVVVRAARYPATQARRPDDWEEIAAGAARTGQIGHFASVALASLEKPLAKAGGAGVPLWRGYGMHARYVGLE